MAVANCIRWVGTSLLAFFFNVAVADQASVVAQETLVKEFASLRILDAKGSPIRKAEENWDRAATLVAGNPDWKSWLTSRQQAFEKWISIPRDNADFLPGNGFKLLDPGTGMPLKWHPEMAQPKRGGAVGDDLWRAWVSWNRSHNLSRIQEAARMYRLTGKSAYRDWAVSQIDFYAKNYSAWPLQSWNGKARMMSQSLDEATALMALIDAVRLLSGADLESKRREWFGKLFLPIVRNLQDFSQGVNNIAVWHASAIAVTAIEYGDEAMLDQALNGEKGLRTLLNKGITADHLWHEGSFAYNNYVIAALTPLFVHASLEGRETRIRPLLLQAQNMLFAPLAFRFNDGYLPTVGDSRHRSKAIDLATYLSVVRVLPTPIGVVEAQRIKTWDTLLDQISLPSQPARLPAVTTRLFEPSRAAILKNDKWQTFVRFGQLTHAHAQPEVPGYELYFGSTPVAIDQGTVDYGSPWHENYFRRGVAHNVPLVDGEGQDAWNPGELLQFRPAPPEIVARQKNYRSGMTVTRKFSLLESEFIDSTVVSPGDGGATIRRLGMVFNTDCELRFDNGVRDRFTAAKAPSGTGFSFWSNVLVTAMPEKWQAQLQCGDHSLDLFVHASRPHMLYRAQAPATPLPRKRNVLYLEHQGAEAKYEIRIASRGNP